MTTYLFATTIASVARLAPPPSTRKVRPTKSDDEQVKDVRVNERARR